MPLRKLFSLACEDIGTTPLKRLSSFVCAVAVENQTTSGVSTRLSLRKHQSSCSGIKHCAVVFGCRLLCDHEILHSIIGRIKLSQMSGVSMTQTRAPKQLSVVVETCRTDDDLIKSIIVHVTTSDTMRSLSIDSLSRSV